MGDAAEARDTRRTFIVPAIKSFDHYDFGRAKICSSVAWLVAKAFGTDSVPAELREPFYTDQYNQEHMKPPVAGLLLSAELYCRAGSLILKSDAAKPLLGHDAVIRALAQRGLYVTDQERLVTERDLSKKPIQMSAHLAMIDTLMMAYTVETVSVEKVVSCVQQYASFYPDGDVPYDTEEAVTCWINKVNEYLKDIIVNEQKARENQSTETSGGSRVSRRARYRKEQSLPRQVPWIPLVDNLLKDCADGCALAALLHFYCPDIVKLEDICLKETMSLADSLYNLQLVQDFCQEYLSRCCHFTLEDMLYAASSVKNNFLVFMAELFWWFEVVKPPFVQPRVLDTEGRNVYFWNHSMALKANFCSSKGFYPLKHLTLSFFFYSSDDLNVLSVASGEIKRSTSMSFIDGCVGTWPKEKRSSTQGVSFDIPFDEENTMEPPTTTGREMTRSVSTDGLGFKVQYMPRSVKRNLSFQPVDGLSRTVGIEEEEGCPAMLAGAHPERQSRMFHPRNLQGLPNGQALDEHGNPVATPSMEEALKIIHSSEKPQSSNDGFFLHSQDRGALGSKGRADDGDLDSMSESKGAMSTDTTEVDTGIHVRTEDIQETLDEDSSLKDYTGSMDLDMDHDYELRASRQDTPSPSPSLTSGKSPVGSTTSTSSGVKMTSFAEQKFKKLNHFEGKSSGSSSQKTTPEGSELSIPHMVSWATTPEASPIHQSPKDPTQIMASEMVQLRMKLEEKRRAIEAQKKKVEAAFTRHRQRMGRTAFLTVVKKKEDGTSPLKEEAAELEERQPSKAADDSNLRPGKYRTDTPDGAEQGQARWQKSPNEESIGEADLLEYTRSIEKLNASLSLLQAEMQRLAQQQELIMQMREQQSWVVSPPQPSPQKQVRELRNAARSSGIKKKSASFHSKTPRTQRPSELKITPFNRVLTVPQSVDSLPRLRRFSPSQSQVSSFSCLGDDTKPPPEAEATEKDTAPEIKLPPSTSNSPTKSVSSEPLTSPVKQPQPKEVEEKTFTVTSSASPADVPGQSTRNLIEVPLSVLKPLEGQMLEEARGEGSGDFYDDDQKMCCGFFFKDDMKGEDDMAMKRAMLLEKRMRREKELQQRKQQLEAEMEQKKEEARMKAEEERQKKEEEKARREFIKQEYLRRKQLKLMEDMDTVIKPRPLGAKQKKPRPKSIHRDSMESPKTPARAAAVSSLSLASLNLGDNDSVQSDKRTPRPDSADGFLSPCRSGSRNGDKDWENASTTSSVASNTEYTGPKLYKEPSAKSNKYIIQNALTHCCLAGKVNEGQKNKILEEMEKSEANNFLILFRDSGCQFRSLYTYCPETEEITKLTGIGPKSITHKMIEGLYKYNSDRKQFSQIPAKTMSASVDAITIHSHLWQTKKPGTPKKVLPAKS
uniref:Calmodulin regulated spectrin-associated protein family, member 2a n=1 Tax=Scleropages formosus TaxID=113540 RepID=A0A8C9T3V0_SCLFO